MGVVFTLEYRRGMKQEAVSKEVILGIREDGRREILVYEIGREGEIANVLKEQGVEEVEIVMGGQARWSESSDNTSIP